MEKVLKINRNGTNLIKRILAFLDGFYRRFFMSYALLVIITRFTEKKLMGVEEISSYAFLIIVIAAAFISILWTKLDSKIQLSIFDRYLTGNDKQKLIFRRVFWIIVFYVAMGAFIDSENINGFLELITNVIGTLFFASGTIILILSALWILSRQKYKMNSIASTKK